MLALADDFGLEIKAIGGAPGIHSALWGGPERDFNLAMAKVEDAMRKRGATDMTANFTCALVLAEPGGECPGVRRQSVWQDQFSATRHARFRL